MTYLNFSKPLQQATITVLVENTAGRRGLLGEHGLSFWITANDKSLLFDTGQGMALPHNAKILGIALEDLTAIALSHGHYDHTGGLPFLLEKCPNTELFLHPAALQPKYSVNNYIGSPLEAQNCLGNRRLVWTEKPTEIISGVYLTGTIPRHQPLEDTGETFWRDPAHQELDHLPDDQALFLNSPEGWVVILGCAHSGVINTLDYIAQLTGTQQFYLVMGGMHLLYASSDRLQATVAALKTYNVQKIGANHCTGLKALTSIWHSLGERCFDCRVGTRLSFGKSD
jgi:7,8-dihydropterin-6-yl-methyl-4-(beta-D-ribofuranosyl)aminobenzene 5'-phosphate synthase